MLNERYLSKLPVEIVDLFSELENDIIADIARRIAKMGYDTPMVEWQNKKLKQLGYSQHEVNSLINKKLRLIDKKLAKILYDAVDYSVDVDNTLYRKAYDKNLTLTYPLDLKDNPKLLDIVDNMVKQTQWEMHNITRTTAIVASNILVNALDLAWLEYQSGIFTREQVVRNAVEKLGKDGIGIIDYASGKKDQVDVAVRRAVVTGANKTYGQVSERHIKDMGCKLVYVSSHMGARPDHAMWQGKVYCYDAPTEGYKDFRASTGYGTMLGLCGINCRHSFGPYYEGISSVTSPDYDRKVSDRLYEQEQEQRRLERMVRLWKRRENALLSAGIDASSERSKVSEWLGKLNAHCKENGLTKQSARTRV